MVYWFNMNHCEIFCHWWITSKYFQAAKSLLLILETVLVLGETYLINHLRNLFLKFLSSEQGLLFKHSLFDSYNRSRIFVALEINCLFLKLFLQEGIKIFKNSGPLLTLVVLPDILWLGTALISRPDNDFHIKFVLQPHEIFSGNKI